MDKHQAGQACVSFYKDDTFKIPSLESRESVELPAETPQKLVGKSILDYVLTPGHGVDQDYPGSSMEYAFAVFQNTINVPDLHGRWFDHSMSCGFEPIVFGEDQSKVMAVSLKRQIPVIQQICQLRYSPDQFPFAVLFVCDEAPKGVQIILSRDDFNRMYDECKFEDGKGTMAWVAFPTNMGI